MVNENSLLLAFLFAVEIVVFLMAYIVLLKRRDQRYAGKLEALEERQKGFERHLQEQTSSLEEKVQTLEQAGNEGEEGEDEEREIENRIIKEAQTSRKQFIKGALDGLKSSEGDSLEFWRHVYANFDDIIKHHLSNRRSLEYSKLEVSKHLEALEKSAKDNKTKVETLQIKLKDSADSQKEEYETLIEQYEALINEKESLSGSLSALEAAHKSLQDDFDSLEKEYLALYNKREEIPARPTKQLVEEPAEEVQAQSAEEIQTATEEEAPGQVEDLPDEAEDTEEQPEEQGEAPQEEAVANPDDPYGINGAMKEVQEEAVVDPDDPYGINAAMKEAREQDTGDVEKQPEEKAEEQAV